MVNLLFISNSVKIHSIKNTLQPLFKVKIDIVADFDYGLKDVFEKRPATVFIQDQIAGVTGESVARHIQMLLGSGAPSFIYMHEGSPKAKPIKGLFEYLIDMSQTDVKIVADIQATLKSLLGLQWEKIYVPPQIASSTLSDTEVIPKDSRAFIDKQVDEFLSDLDKPAQVSATKSSLLSNFSDPTVSADIPFTVVSSAQDQLAEMVFEAQKNSDSSKDDVVRAGEVPVQTTAGPVPGAVTVNNVINKKVTTPPEAVAPGADNVKPAPKVIEPEAVVSKPTNEKISDVIVVNTVSTRSESQNVSVADFVIHGEKQPEAVAPEELLRVFEGNYHQSSGGWKRYAVLAVVVVCVAGGIWYLLEQKPQLFSKSFRSSDKPQIAAPEPRLINSDSAISKPESQSTQKDNATSLPTFIPLTGLDSSFTSQKPGWERYTDAKLDFRIYRSAGKIQALQVLGIKNQDISETKLKSILIELLGDSEYSVSSNEKKLDYIVSRASVGKKADLLIYRKDTALRAFVIALN